MGIDVYLKWDKQTDEDRMGQFTGFSVTSGHLGYLREAYHGGPYATTMLVREAFDDPRPHTCGESEAECEPCGGVAIPVATLRERLPATVFTALVRDATLYSGGRDPSIINLDEHPDAGLRAMMERVKEAAEALRHEGGVAVPEKVARLVAMQMALWRAADWLPPVAQSYADFVALAEAKERAGLNPKVYVSA